MSNLKKKETILTSIGPLFYVSRFFGAIAYSIPDYYKNKELKISILANIWGVIIMFQNIVQYHFATISSSFGNSETDFSTLTMVIGIFIIYMEPFMMAVDGIAAILNQKQLISCFERIQKVDDKLKQENIVLSYKRIKLVANLCLCCVIFGEILLIVFNFFQFQLSSNAVLQSIWWFVTGIPIFTNSVARIWFIVLVYVVRQRFEAINEYFIKTKDLFLEKKRKHQQHNRSNQNNEKNFERHEIVGYLDREIFGGGKVNRVTKRNIDTISGITRHNIEILDVVPFDNKNQKINKGNKIYPQSITQDDMVSFNDKEFLVEDKMDKKLILICRLHDEICEIGKLVNRMFSFQMLITMAYGFMSITAQFYFLYCGLVGQVVPILFRSAENVWISIIYIVYTAGKCVVVIFISWKTKMNAQKTGVHLHKIANVVDENHFYHIVNHLSLKLLNHQLNFTACGFFDLDMTTVYAITGAITSYLIILIQFNLAAQKAKSSVNNTMNATNMTNVTIG